MTGLYPAARCPSRTRKGSADEEQHGGCERDGLRGVDVKSYAPYIAAVLHA